MYRQNFSVFSVGIFFLLLLNIDTFVDADLTDDVSEDDIDVIALKLKIMQLYANKVNASYKFDHDELESMTEDDRNYLLLTTTYSRFQYIWSFIRFATCYIANLYHDHEYRNQKIAADTCKVRAVLIYEALEQTKDNNFFEFYHKLLDREIGATYSIRQAIAQQEKLEKYAKRMKRMFSLGKNNIARALIESSKNLETRGAWLSKRLTYGEINILLIEFFGEDLQHLSRYMNSAFVDDKEVDSERLIYPHTRIDDLWVEDKRLDIAKLFDQDIKNYNSDLKFAEALPYVTLAEVPNYKFYGDLVKKLSNVGVRLAYQPSGASEMVFRLDKSESRPQDGDTVRVEGNPKGRLESGEGSSGKKH